MDPDHMLQAHVRFELARWSDDAIEATVADEVSAAFDWLAGVAVSDLAGPDEVAAVVRDAILLALEDNDARGELLAAVARGFTGGMPPGSTVADLLPRQEFDRLVDVAVSLRSLRVEVIAQVTSSPAYADLIAHVLYHGLKAFVLTENVLARRVPGASSLVRLGQSAMKSAAPGLERGIDRQVTGFVAANIAESIRESRRYLDDAVDDDMLTAIAQDLWDANASRDVADAGSLLPAEASAEWVAAMADGLARSLRTGPAAVAVHAVADAWFERHGDRAVAAVLADAGVTPQSLLPVVLPGARAVARAARADGFLERRIRQRLAPFYETLR